MTKLALRRYARKSLDVLINLMAETNVAPVRLVQVKQIIEEPLTARPGHFRHVEAEVECGNRRFNATVDAEGCFYDNGPAESFVIYTVTDPKWDTSWITKVIVTDPEWGTTWNHPSTESLLKLTMSPDYQELRTLLASCLIESSTT